ncbi:hypothetical protein BRARA_E01587 [Brassica rapa]|uniref:ATP-dependent DNA helicase n=1 Tax=Brassica campestris TaxID=3711 RepID=A0A397ZGK2_BRACM|nr:hypothetical protein BRARA_E01587 [Brassica rapa]
MRCGDCNALVWLAESTEKDRLTKRPLFTICCKQGRIKLPIIRDPPIELENLLNEPSFRSNIRVFNSLLSMCSMGAEIDYSIVNSGGPFCFKVHGENYHSIGSLLPVDGERPKFLQMYIFDTSNEIKNRLSIMNREGNETLDTQILASLIKMLDENNVLAKIFRKARDKYESGDSAEMKIHMVGYDKRKRQYELPSANEIAGLIVGDFSTTVGERDVLVQHKTGNLQRILATHPLYMSLQYPLLFPYGEIGFYDGIPYVQKSQSNQNNGFVKMTEYYMYRIHNRNTEASTITRSGRLFHQYVVDAFTSIEASRLTFIKLNQKSIRADVYNNVKDALCRGDHDSRSLGKRIVLPSSITGSPRYMAEKYQDAMALCRSYGNPDLFITMTANPKWAEIDEYLRISGDSSANDRSDIESRVFHLKLDQLMAGRENVCSDEVDKFVSAELPDRIIDPEGYKLVEQHMMHGPCGLDKPNNSCMENGICTKKYPRPFCLSSCLDDKGYIIYKRRDLLSSYVMKGDIKLDNQYVVPHNLDLLKQFQAHINVEFCNKTSAIKYLFKYITKGVDKATVVLENKSNDENEIENYLDCRYVSACESMWLIFKFEIHHQHPPVQRLSIHLPGQQPALFNDSSDLEQVVSNCEFRPSMFMAYLETNKIDPDARNLTYVQFPTKYVWNKTEHTWTKRKIGQSIGRLYNVHPSSGELYYLRLLINHLKGPTSFEDILTVNGIEYKKFHESCVARGLLDGDEEWHEAMTEAATWATPQQLRELFVMLLVHCEVSSPLKLWNAFWKCMSEDIVYQQRRLLNFTDYDLSDVELQIYTLIEVELLLFQYDQSLSNYTDLPKLDKSSIGRLSNTVLADEQYLNVQCLKDSSKEQISLLNEEQKEVYEAVLESVHNSSGKLFFLYGPGGTGKTFVYNTIINKLRSEKNIVIPVASSVT